MKTAVRESTNISILLVDDHEYVLRALRRTLDAETNVVVIGEASNMSEALCVLKKVTPTVVLLDLALDKEDCFKLIDHIYAHQCRGRILVFSMHSEYLFAERCIRHGASGYLRKGCAPEVLIKAIRHVAGGGIYISEIIQREILDRIRGIEATYDMKPLQQLTDRELEVFHLIGQGYGTTEIAEKMGLNTKTVQAHQSHIRAKMQIEDQEKLRREASELVLTNMID